MDHAWLDSLSEDWVSQPRSSGSPAPSLPSLSNSTNSNSHAKSSRIPKFNPQQQAWTAPHDSNSPLSERSLNDHNIPLSQRGSRRPSKLRSEISTDLRGRQHSRTFSASTSHSTQVHTVQHKSTSLSPTKGLHETPEWKRRLLKGDVAYGEQRDLFSPAGLETIFQPPPPQNPSSSRGRLGVLEEASTILPSSPPPYDFRRKLDEATSDNLVVESRQPTRPMKYNLVDDGSSSFSRNSSGQMIDDLESRIPSERSKARDNDSVLRKPELLDGRTVSGQSDIRNEEFSPVFVGKQDTIDGKIHYAAMNLPVAELHHRLEHIEEGPVSKTNDLDDSSSAFQMNATSETEDARDGRFINLRRGGYSLEGSFQKRPLSPSSLPALDQSAMLPEESMQASTPKELSDIRKTRMSEQQKPTLGSSLSPAIPQTPHASPRKSGQKSSGGSPLKIFDNYDTFTNQKLLRRLSQFEGDYESAHRPLREDSTETKSEINEGFMTTSSPKKSSQTTGTYQHTSRKLTSFGDGDLDTYQFSEDLSYSPYESNSGEENEDQSLPPLYSDSQATFKFQLDPSPALEYGSVTQRRERYTKATKTSTMRTISVQKYESLNSSRSMSAELPPTRVIENLQTPRKRNGDSDGKRLPKTPLKDSTPKRRRTFHRNETTHAKIEHESPDLDSLKDTHQQMQSVLGRKRKDARHDDDQKSANPKILAMRQILRPRTPSQRSNMNDLVTIGSASRDSLEQARILQEQKIARIQAELDSTDPPRAAMALAVSQQMQSDSRKGSVTTQDFLDEAKKIMAGIRGKARSGLASLEESESENDKNISPDDVTPGVQLDDSYQESTQEPFSRPPSRDGKPMERPPAKQEDPAVLDHLRKYQEMSDMELVIASSVKSLAMAKEAAKLGREWERVTNETLSRSQGHDKEEHIESDPPNIRISENPEAQRKRKHSTSSVPMEDPAADFPSHGSNGSSGQSTSRSIPTGSSRGSDSRRNIAPHTVSHLIPEQVAGMVLDRKRNIWIKRKVPSGEKTGLNFLPSDETEDDPFGDIPDLSVDETQEAQRLKAVAAKKLEAEREGQYKCDQAESAVPTSQHEDLKACDILSSEPSKVMHFNSSVDAPGTSTRATSWGDTHASTTKPAVLIDRKDDTHDVTAERVVEDVEEEISILEDRIKPHSSTQRRNITISFSSPLTSIIEPPDYHAEHDLGKDGDDRNKLGGGDEAHGRNNGSLALDNRRNHQQYTKVKMVKTRKALRESTTRQISLGGHIFSARPVSRIDEQDEELFSMHQDGQRERSISVMVTTPLPATRSTSVALTTPRQTYEVGNLSLTPLSEFTMHHGDESFGLDVSYIERSQRNLMGLQAKRTLSLSIKELVEKITQVEPYEPFWEHMKQLSLRDKRLTNLHKLDEFCEQLEELDASRNQVSQLHGVPRTIRYLQVSHNHLSDMAAWGHLRNLQYVDVSNNDLESLGALHTLIHLRSLKADNNRIRSLDGISQLDGLLNLRARGNLIESLDFSGTKLHRLSALDLRDNRISSIQNIQELRALSSIDLEGNDLFEFSISNTEVLWALKYLKLAGNSLEKIDVSRCPNLRLLYLDRNKIGNIAGLLKTKHLDSLSLREQEEGSLADMSFLSDALEVRKLFLSGNLLSTFQPQVDFLNLQYLELANCGLETLSPEFGHMVANVRVLNLNFNALKDIKPLDGIVRLKKLHLAGNRLTRLRTTTCILSQFQTLSFVDLRNNPITQGFYPPLTETKLVLHQDLGEEEDAPASQYFILGSADRVKDSRYAGRLDMETRMLRRVFEILVLSGCPRLKILDGLTVDWSVLGSRDNVWDFLVQSGVVMEDSSRESQRRADGNEAQNKTEVKPVASERWQGEDSFA